MSIVNRQGLYLFLTIDIVGSTAFKNSNNKIGSNTHWMNFYNGFYENFANELNELNNGEEIFDISLLKSLGDELVFYSKLNKSIDLPKLLEIFCKAIKQYRNAIEELPINVKGNAWVAGVPFLNMIVEKNGEISDFNGPQIDTGFRISKFSTIEYFTISADIVYILSVLYTSADIKLSNETMKIISIKFLNLESLKGVNKGKKYPIYYLNLSNVEISLFNESIKKSDNIIDYNKTKLWLEEYYYSKNMVDSNFKPFIENDIFLNEIPKDYSNNIKKSYENYADDNLQGNKSIDLSKIQEIINKVSNS